MVTARQAASPLGERFNIETVIQGIADDIAALRAGKITVDDARVRGELAKQFMNGVRLVIHAQKFLEERAKIAAITTSQRAEK
jgi:hypothetical protein